MSKKTIALSTMLLSVLLVLITVETVTGRGILNAQCTFYETISPFGKYFNLELGDKITLEWLKITTFICTKFLIVWAIEKKKHYTYDSKYYWYGAWISVFPILLVYVYADYLVYPPNM